MSDIICISNRKLCREDFLLQIEKIAAIHPKAIILREKDLSLESYQTLAEQVLHICQTYGTLCILHSQYETAKKLGCTAVHLPLPLLRKVEEKDKTFFKILGTSVHSIEEAVEAQKLGCTYLIAGHIFETDCKRGIQGRGLEFLQQIKACVQIPVYAIGGICSQNIEQVRSAGADGVCMMRALMQCENPKIYQMCRDSD